MGNVDKAAVCRQPIPQVPELKMTAFPLKRVRSTATARNSAAKVAAPVMS
jgi:hypothetical protein